MFHYTFLTENLTMCFNLRMHDVLHIRCRVGQLRSASYETRPGHRISEPRGGLDRPETLGYLGEERRGKQCAYNDEQANMHPLH